MMAPLAMPISNTCRTSSYHCMRGSRVALMMGARCLYWQVVESGWRTRGTPPDSVQRRLGRGKCYGVRVVERAVLDLATTHVRQRGVTGVAEAPRAQHAVVVAGSEDRIADG